MSTLSGLRGWVRVALRAATARPPNASAARAPTVRTSPMLARAVSLRTCWGRRRGSAGAAAASSAKLGSRGRRGHQHPEAWLPRRPPRVHRRLPAVGTVVQDDLPEVDRMDAVHERLVDCCDPSEAAPREPLDDVDLPQRARAVHASGLDPADELLELLLRPRC